MVKQMHGYQGGGYAIDDYGNRVDLTARALQGQRDGVDDATKVLQGYRQVQASMISKQLGLSQAIIDANKALRENADGFDTNTQAGSTTTR